MADEKKKEEKKEEKKQEEPPKPPTKPYYLIVVGDDAPQIIRCEDRAGFEDAVRTNVLGAKSTIYAFGFVGDRINITAPSPMCAIQVGDEIVKFGDASPQFEDSGRIVPLVRQEDDA
jgi:hypothetical protein